MALPQETRASFRALVESGNIRYITSPAAAVGTAIVSDSAAAAWAWAAYVQIVAAAPVDPCWLCGLGIHTCVIEHHYGDIAIATGAAGFEVDIAMFPYRGLFVGATAVMAAMPIGSHAMYLPYPVRIAGAPRLAARLRKDTAASAAGVTGKLILATAVGT